MKFINQKKLARQISNIDKWLSNGCRGTVEAVTGYGKTYVAILTIQRLHAKYPGSLVDVVLPKINLLEDWIDPLRGHIAIHSLNNVEAFVVNTYIKFERRFPVLIVLDEIHNYASEGFGKVFEISGAKKIKDLEEIGKPPFVLGLTATLERNDGKHKFIEEYCPVIDTISLEEAKRERYISKFKTYNLGLRFSEEEQAEYDIVDTTFRNAFAKFNHNFDLAMACCKARGMFTRLTVPVKKIKLVDGVNILIEEMTDLNQTSQEWQQYFAYYNGWDGSQEHPWNPKEVSRIAQQFSACMRNRKLMIYKAKIKIDIIEEIVNKYPNLKTITFSEDTEFADLVAERLGPDRCKSYHSKIKGAIVKIKEEENNLFLYKEKKLGADKHKAWIILTFKNGEYQVLSTVKAVDEGLDDEAVDLGIQASYTSSKRQNIQRNGRNTRKDEVRADKMALTVNLYMIGTQEEKWLNDKQRGMRDVEWISSVEEINFDELEEYNFSLT